MELVRIIDIQIDIQYGEDAVAIGAQTEDGETIVLSFGLSWINQRIREGLIPIEIGKEIEGLKRSEDFIQ